MYCSKLWIIFLCECGVELLFVELLSFGFVFLKLCHGTRCESGRAAFSRRPKRCKAFRFANIHGFLDHSHSLPYCVFMIFLCLPKCTAVTSLINVNRLACVMGKQCVFYEVGVGFMSVVYANLMLRLGSQSPAFRLGGRGSIPGQSTWDLWWTKWHWYRFFPEYFGFSLVFIIPSVPHAHLRLHVALTRTKGRNLGIFQKSVAPLAVGDHMIEKCFHFHFPRFVCL